MIARQQNQDRVFSAAVLDKQADSPDASDEARRQRAHFYAMYVEDSGPTITQVGRELRMRRQTGGIDQGDTHGPGHT